MTTLLTNGTIIVRPHEPADADSLYAAVRESIAEISPWLPWCHAGYSRAEAVDFIGFSRRCWAASSEFHFVICSADTMALLGAVSLNHIARINRYANLGYWVRTGAAGRGVATAAARLVAGFGFDTVGLARIEIAAMPENVRSRRVAESIGARFESLARNRLVMHGKAYDAALYSLVPTDLTGAT